MLLAETQQQEDEFLVRHLDGLFVGQLSDEELAAFERCVKRGTARRSYEGVAGFMGLAKVKVIL